MAFGWKKGKERFLKGLIEGKMSETRGLGRIGRREKDDQTEGEDSLAPPPSGPILLKTGCHWLVVTYDPMSSFSPRPGPAL